ncbi:BlaI/MecI/CopY family transcriptional regulator [Chryseobacterium sp.]|uniref:BlaI/MecI/CopY family transcriptional regulator n=1 Tax=Chryseobacterium sp. TaxID=1871047 RepID=UPI0011CB1D06|nr:BlaI/MecI/CopY family transcriptional regulator [Chryseobacterium sp.]TXF79553.1 BlaI/MecI/CopY family transcriptional regulator [Chryseobacterium sp.]
MKIKSLTPAEEVLMNILWKLNSAYMREVMEQYPEPKPHQNTVSTFMKILVEKDFLTTEKEGRIFRYTVAVPLEDYKRFQLKIFLSTYFQNSGIELVKTLLDQKLLEPTELEPFMTFRNKPSVSATKKETAMSDFIEEITSDKKPKKKAKKKDKKKKK